VSRHGSVILLLALPMISVAVLSQRRT
jgi:hypothetical protein